MYFQYFFNNLANIYIYPILFKFSYISIYLYNYVISKCNKSKSKYILKNIYLYKNKSFIKYNITDIYNKPTDFNYIKIDYTYKNKPFQMLINSSKIGAIYDYFPPYNDFTKLNSTYNLNKILSANLKYENKSIDITNQLNELAGPMNNFYNDILDNEQICTANQIFPNSTEIEIIDDFANNFTIKANQKIKI